MSASVNDRPNPQNQDYLRLLLKTARKRPGLWFVPLFSALLIAVLMGYLGPKNWDAKQTFSVREELIGGIVGPGRFESLDTMKSAQETIQEAARQTNVIRRVLLAVEGERPSPEAIESMQGAISFSAAGGAEVGKTELLTMRVQSSSPEKAKALVERLFLETQAEVRAIRQRRAASMVAEGEVAVQLAEERLDEATQTLRQAELRVGDDLSELRSLNQEFAGGGELRRMQAQIESDLRAAEVQRQEVDQLIEILENAIQDPNQLLSLQKELVESQPILRDTKTRLIEARVKQAEVGGLYSEQHPLYRAAAKAADEVHQHVREEMQNALAGLQSQKNMAAAKVETLKQRSREIKERMTELAAMRVDYDQRVAQTQLRKEELNAAEKQLGQAESIYRAASAVDFMHRIDDALPGLRPLGPSKKTLVLVAAVAGSLIGMGLIMMVTPPPTVDPRQPAAPPQAPTVTQPETPVASNPQRPRQTPADTGEFVTTVQGSPGPGFVIPDIGPAFGTTPGQTVP